MASRTVDDVWALDSDPDWLAAARGRTHAMAAPLDSTWATQGRGISSLEEAWAGARADSYLGYAAGLRSALAGACGHATTISQAVRELEDHLTEAQDRLARSYVRAIDGSTAATRRGGVATFTYPDDEPVPPAIGREHGVAEGIVSDARAAVQRCAEALSGAAQELTTLGSAWSGPAHGEPGWDIPRGGVSGVTITQLGNRVVVNSGDSSDDVSISVDPDTGETLVNINGEVQRVPRGVAITSNTGGGNDRIVIDETVPNRIRIVAGDGDDSVVADESGNHLDVFAGAGDDTVETGSGWDYVSGGTGHDYVDSGMGDDLIAGGAGNDVLYGMDGDDIIIGGTGQDYLEGARGDDIVLGMDGDDIVSGGRGDDILAGGAGDDVLYAGLGEDSLEGGTGSDSTFATAGDTVAGAETTKEVVIEDRPWDETFSINGDDAFTARVQADLDMLGSSPTSQALLAEIRAHVDDGGDLVDINATDGGNTGGTSVAYNTSNLLVHGDDAWYKDGRPPVIGFYHELGHINQWRQPGGPGRWYDGNEPIRDADGQPLLERQNVGLSWDYDDDPNTPDGVDPDWDFRFTENGLREEFGLPRRDRY